jgi:hypothetical protein
VEKFHEEGYGVIMATLSNMVIKLPNKRNILLKLVFREGHLIITKTIHLKKNMSYKDLCLHLRHVSKDFESQKKFPITFKLTPVKNQAYLTGVLMRVEDYGNQFAVVFVFDKRDGKKSLAIRGVFTRDISDLKCADWLKQWADYIEHSVEDKTKWL